jgi:hypothetical protein
MTELTVTLPAGLWWTSNDLRGSHHRWDSKAKAVRLLGKSAAILSGLRLTPPVTLHVFVGYPTRVIADPPNVAGTVAKHALDGMVTDAGLLPGDDSRFIIATTYSRDLALSRPKEHTLRFVFEEVAA